MKKENEEEFGINLDESSEGDVYSQDVQAEKQEDKTPPEEGGEEKKENLKVFWYIIAFIFLVFLLIFSVKFFDKKSGENQLFQTKEYNGFEFVNISGLWMTEIQDKTGQVYQVPLHYGPWDLENVSIAGRIDERFNASRIYITFSPNATEFSHLAIASSEISNNLHQVVNAQLTAACTQNGTGCETRPIVTCDSTNDTVIYLSQEAEEASVFLSGNCIVVQGRKWNVVRAAERLIYQMYAVMA